MRSKQLEEAAEWCRINYKSGLAAINSRKFPLIKDLRTINKWIDAVIVAGNEKDYCSIFTKDEEESLVCYIRSKTR